MGEDWFVASVDRVARAASIASEDLRAAVEELVGSTRAARADGRSLIEIVDLMAARKGREMRLRAISAFQEYERAVADMRAGVVRALVDEEGMTLSEAGLRLKISRQAATRLYRNGKAISEDDHEESD
jgi:hypothetical protein